MTTPKTRRTPAAKTVPRVNEATSEQLVAAFLAYAEHDRSWRPDTVRRYSSVLTRLDGVADWTLDDADQWWTSRRGSAPATRENELAVLRSFFRWMTRWDHRADDPTRRLTAPKIEKTVPKFPGRDELVNHLKAAHDEGEHAVRRTLALMSYTGCRVGEAARADWVDVERESRRIVIHGKGGKERRFGLSQSLLDELLPAPPTGRGNIVSGDGVPGQQVYTEGTLQRKVNRWLERHGSDYTCHAFRKRAASMAGRVVPAPALAEAFGWASVNTASVYVGGSDAALDRMADAAAGTDDRDTTQVVGLELVAEALRAVGMAEAADKLIALIQGEPDD